jgi:hypothetical protein
VFDAFGAHTRAKKCVGYVNSICNEARTKPVFGELLPNVVLRLGQRGMRGVAQVRGHGGTRCNSGLDLHWGGFRMTDARDHA